MINKVLSIEEGRNAILQALPHIERCDASDCELVEVDGGALIIKVHGRRLKVASPEDKALKSMTGVDSAMMSHLNADLRNQCWEHLMGNSNKELTLKTRDSQVIGLQSGESNLLNYREWTDRIIDAVDRLDGIEGIANITKNHFQVGFGIVTKVNHEPVKRRGDFISRGVYVSLNGCVSARPYNLRLACLNGAVATEQGDALHLSEAHWKEQVSTVLHSAKIFTEDFAALAERPLSDPGGLVGSLSRHGILTSHMTTLVVQQLAALEESATEYDLVNLVTSQQHARPNEMTWLIAGGRAMDYLHKGHCTRCGQQV